MLVLWNVIKTLYCKRVYPKFCFSTSQGFHLQGYHSLLASNPFSLLPNDFHVLSCISEKNYKTNGKRKEKKKGLMLVLWNVIKVVINYESNGF